MLVGRVAQLHHEALERRSKVSQPPVDLIGLLAHFEIDAEFLVLVFAFLFMKGVVIFAFLFMVAVVIFALLCMVAVVIFALLCMVVVMMMTVKIPGERIPIGSIVGANAEADESAVAKPAKAAIAVRRAGPRVFDLSLGGGIVPGSEAVGTAPEPPPALSVVQAGRTTSQRVGRAPRPLEVALHTVRMRAEARVAADGVDDAAPGIAAVEKRRGDP